MVKAALFIEKKLHLTNVGFKELLTLKAAFSKGLKSQIFKSFPNIVVQPGAINNSIKYINEK